MVLILEIKHLFGVGTTFIYKNDASYHNNVKMSEIANKVGNNQTKKSLSKLIDRLFLVESN